MTRYFYLHTVPFLIVLLFNYQSLLLIILMFFLKETNPFVTAELS